MLRAGLLAVVLACSVPGVAAAQAAADAAALAVCIDEKSGPEGDLPSSGPKREKLLKQMEGGTQACLFLVRNACKEAGGDPDACTARESKAWLKAVADVKGEHLPEKNRTVWRAAGGRLQAQAIAICEATAALSAWGAEKVTQKGRFGMGLSHPCVAEAIAQQAIIMLSQVRGN